MAKMRACLQVEANKYGYCKCAKYGTPQEGQKSFQELCMEKKLPIKVGNTFISIDKGGQIMRRRLSELEEYDDISILNDLEDTSDIEDILGLEEFDMEFVKEFAVIGAGSAVAGIGYGLIEDKVIGDKIKSPKIKALIKIGVGLFGAYFLRNVNRPLAYGIGGSLIGGGITDIAKDIGLLGGAQPPAGAQPPVGTQGLYDLPAREEIYSLSAGDDYDIVPTEGVEEEKTFATAITEERPLLGQGDEEEVALSEDEGEEEPVMAF